MCMWKPALKSASLAEMALTWVEAKRIIIRKRPPFRLAVSGSHPDSFACPLWLAVRTGVTKHTSSTFYTTYSGPSRSVASQPANLLGDRVLLDMGRDWFAVHYLLR